MTMGVPQNGMQQFSFSQLYRGVIAFTMHIMLKGQAVVRENYFLRDPYH